MSGEIVITQHKFGVSCCSEIVNAWGLGFSYQLVLRQALQGFFATPKKSRPGIFAKLGANTIYRNCTHTNERRDSLAVQKVKNVDSEELLLKKHSWR